MVSSAVVSTVFHSFCCQHPGQEHYNKNAQKRKDSGMKFQWTPITERDFYVFLAVVLFSGLVQVPERSDLWKKAYPYNFPFPACEISRNRWESIMWSLHISDPDDDKENEKKKNSDSYDRLFKIKPLYTEIVAACQAHFHPAQNISIDERMVASKARIHFKQYKTFFFPFCRYCCGEQLAPAQGVVQAQR